jgi:hypothetical protein
VITLKRLSCALSLVGIAATMTHSEEASSEYVSPSEAVPKGRAPKMQVQLPKLMIEMFHISSQ